MNTVRRSQPTTLLLTVLAAVALSLLGAATTARAEGLVVASEPMEHQELSKAPGWVTLAFGDVVDPGVAKMIVLDPTGRNVTTGELIVEGSNVTSQLRDGLSKGTYTVQYRIDRPDGQPQGGAFQFSYGPGNWTKVESKQWSGADQEPPVMRNPDPNATRTEEPEPSASTSVPDVEAQESEGPTVTPSAPPASSTPTGTTSASGEPVPASEPPSPEPSGGAQEPSSSSPVWPWVVGGVVVLGAIAAATVVLARRSRYRP